MLDFFTNHPGIRSFHAIGLGKESLFPLNATLPDGNFFILSWDDHTKSHWAIRCELAI